MSYIDSTKRDAAVELAKLGGARTILATVTSKAMSALIPRLSTRGKLIVIDVGMDPIELSLLDLISGNRFVAGHASGASIDLQDTLALSACQSVVVGALVELPW